MINMPTNLPDCTAKMSNNSKPSIDWDPYIQDVISIYITQDKTAEETILHLREKHGIEATWVKSYSSYSLPLCIQNTKMPRRLHQFNYKFGGLKYISEKDWTDRIIPASKKRALEGKESEVYHYGVRLSRKRLKKAFDRYSPWVSRDFMNLDTSAGNAPLQLIQCQWLTLFPSNWNESQRSVMH